MKTLLFSILLVAIGAEVKTAAAVKASTSIPNVICIYRNYAGTWESFGGWAAPMESPDGTQHMFGEVDTSTHDSNPPGKAMCTSYDILERGKFVITTFAFNKAFDIESGVCRPKAEAGSWSVENQVKVDPAPGLATEMTVQLQGQQYKYINYFMTSVEATSWIQNISLLNQKCLALLPGSVPLPPQ